MCRVQSMVWILEFVCVGMTACVNSLRQRGTLHEAELFLLQYIFFFHEVKMTKSYDSILGIPKRVWKLS